jgi:hypothetical protein
MVPFMLPSIKVQGQILIRLTGIICSSLSQSLRPGEWNVLIGQAQVTCLSLAPVVQGWALCWPKHLDRVQIVGEGHSF